jgi:hypothetical protein
MIVEGIKYISLNSNEWSEDNYSNIFKDKIQDA